MTRRAGQVVARLLVVDVEQLVATPTPAPASPARSARRRGRRRSGPGSGNGSAGGRPGLNSLSTSSPQTLPNETRADEVLDVDAAVAQGAALLVGLGDLGLEGDDAFEPRDEGVSRAGHRGAPRQVVLTRRGNSDDGYPQRATVIVCAPTPTWPRCGAVYARTGLDEASIAADPLAQFDRWMQDAIAAGLPEPNAMVLATATTDGVPSARTSCSRASMTGASPSSPTPSSRKGAELAANPQAALVFPWLALERQVRVTGPVSVVDRAEAADYFASRPHGSQLGAWASPQSQVIGAARLTLDARLAEVAERWTEGDAVPLPDFWGGYRVAPEEVEFWAGRADRLHDRLRFRVERDPDAPDGWLLERLAP